MSGENPSASLHLPADKMKAGPNRHRGLDHRGWQISIPCRQPVETSSPASIVNSDMKRYVWIGLLCAIASLTSLSFADSPTAPDPKAIAWQPWSDSVFADAKREHKFVLLDLQAVWCHWCHVMDEKTYRRSQGHRADPVELYRHPRRPGFAPRSREPLRGLRLAGHGGLQFADGGEIVKRSGFFPPEQMISMLQAIIADPSPGPVRGESKRCAIERRGFPHRRRAQGAEATIRRRLRCETGRAGGTEQKFLNWDNVEYCLVRAQAGDENAKKMARQTLAAQLKLVDPAWSGVDQYSAGDDWDHPHFEKIMQMQSENTRIYAEAYALWKDPVYLKTAEGIYGYVRAFLTSPDGVVYVSQDADLVPGEHAGDYFKLDDAARRKLGLPRVDNHIYARENGWFIRALTTLYAASGDAHYRDEAIRAADLDHPEPLRASRRIPSRRRNIWRLLSGRQPCHGPGLPRSLRHHRRSQVAPSVRADGLIHRRPFFLQGERRVRRICHFN